jgi:hypothetical protein
MRRQKVMPALEVLNEWFYEEPSGVLRWKKDYWSDRGDSRLVGKAGEVAGRARRGGVQIGLHSRIYSRSRLIYKMHEGKEPTGVVKHLNQNPLDDRFENLNDVPASPNVRDARERDGDYFVVTSRTALDGHTIKTVSLSWRCHPDEDADAIAAELNRRNGDYLRQLAQQGHEERVKKLLRLVAKKEGAEGGAVGAEGEVA